MPKVTEISKPNHKRWQLRCIATWRPPDVAPLVIGFHYEAHKTLIQHFCDLFWTQRPRCHRPTTGSLTFSSLWSHECIPTHIIQDRDQGKVWNSSQSRDTIIVRGQGKTRRETGGTENARMENAGRSNTQGRKTRDWKTRHQTAVLENAGKAMYGKPNGVLQNNVVFSLLYYWCTQLFEDALIQCICFPGHESVRLRKRVIGVLDEDRK